MDKEKRMFALVEQYKESGQSVLTRWTIEVFFKDAKQNLKLGKCQSNDFDAQIATTSLAFMHYIVLALGKRFESYETMTMGEVFRAFKGKMLETDIISKNMGFADRII